MASSTVTRRSRTPCRARAALAWGLLLFAVLQIPVRLALHRHPEIADLEYGRKLADLRDRIARNPGRPLVLMLGSSRVATGFRPDVLARNESPASREPIAFNFAQVGSGPEMAHLCLHRLLAAGIRPDTVLVELWPPTWGADRTLKEFLTQTHLGGLTWSDEQLLRSYVTKPKRLDRMWLATQWAPLWSNRLVLLHRFAPMLATNATAPDHRCEHLDRWGWWSPTATVSEAESRQLAARYEKIYAPRLSRFEVRAMPDRALRAIVALCRRERIKVAVVVLPEGAPFRGLYPATARAEVARYLDRVRDEIHVPVIDAREWVADAGFMDGHHLLPTGATVFTKRLGREALPSLLADRPGTLRR